jgi:integrase
VPEALKVRDALMLEVLAGEKRNAGTGNATCGFLLENYLDRLKRTSRPDSDTYQITRGTVAKHVAPFFAQMKAERIDRQTLETFQSRKLKEGLGQVSVNRMLGYLRTAFKLGRKDKLTNNEPDFSTAIVRRAEEDNARTGIIKDPQYLKLVEALESEPHVQTLFVLCRQTGVRPAESFRINWDQVLWDDRLISVFKRQAKIGKPRFLPLNDTAFDQLSKWRDFLSEHVKNPEYIFTHPVTGKQMTKDDYKNVWARACLACGYGRKERNTTGRKFIKTDLLFYDARRAFRTYLPTTVSKTDGKSVMGQTQDGTFDRYLGSKEAAERVLEAMQPAAPTVKVSVLEKIAALKELSQLLKDGTITQEEFAGMKAAL